MFTDGFEVLRFINRRAEDRFNNDLNPTILLRGGSLYFSHNWSNANLEHLVEQRQNWSSGRGGQGYKI